MVAADDTDCRQTVVCGKNIPYVCRAYTTGSKPVPESVNRLLIGRERGLTAPREQKALFG